MLELEKTLVECGSFFLAEKHRDAAMFFGQLPRDFLSLAFFGKRSARPTDPLSLVLSLGKSFQRGHEPTGRSDDSTPLHGNPQTIRDVDESVRHRVPGMQKRYAYRPRRHQIASMQTNMERKTSLRE